MEEQRRLTSDYAGGGLCRYEGRAQGRGHQAQAAVSACLQGGLNQRRLWGLTHEGASRRSPGGSHDSVFLVETRRVDPPVQKTPRWNLLQAYPALGPPFHRSAVEVVIRPADSSLAATISVTAGRTGDSGDRLAPFDDLAHRERFNPWGGLFMGHSTRRSKTFLLAMPGAR